MKNGRVRPPLKWAGGKYRVLPKILQHLPSGARLIEPFVGSGAVFLNSAIARVHINDVNLDLVNFYKALKEDGEGFTRAAARLFSDRNNSRARYYELREEFNGTKDSLRKSALFLFLNRHSYNGLCRYNLSGGFNVPFGKHKRPYFPRKELLGCSRRLQGAAISSDDFEKVMKSARSGDVIYCDPPYVPLSDTSNFTAYSARGFDLDSHRRLAQVAAEVAAKGIPVLVSNHLTAFTMKIYKDAKQRFEFPVRRFISCNGEKRGLTREILALYTV